MDDYNAAVLHGIVKIASRWEFPRSSLTRVRRFLKPWVSQRVDRQIFLRNRQPGGWYHHGDIEKQVDETHSQAFDPLGLTVDLTLDSLGKHKEEASGEEHRYNPQTIHMLQQSTNRKL